jgi:hypothetical protein
MVKIHVVSGCHGYQLYSYLSDFRSGAGDTRISQVRMSAMLVLSVLRDRKSAEFYAVSK